jgi:glycosyltransferase involved in cell wall biosynthesis
LRTPAGPPVGAREHRIPAVSRRGMTPVKRALILADQAFAPARLRQYCMADSAHTDRPRSSPPSVTVILPTYDRLEYLQAAVASVVAQTFTDWELVIADDGSGTATQIYLNSLERTDGVRILRLSHTGNPGAVRNQALQVARGHYVAFIDSDDLWMPTKLATQVEALRRNSSCRWSYTALIRIDAGGQALPTEKARRRLVEGGAIFERLLTLEVAVATPSVLAERQFIDELGGFDEGQLYFEDYDLWLRMSVRSDALAIAEPLVCVRNHAEHYSANRVGVYEARFRLIEKMAGMASSQRQFAILRDERAKTALSLARVQAGYGRGAKALGMLWKSRQRALHAAWWPQAFGIAVRALAPAWLARMVRKNRASTQGETAAAQTAGKVGD